MTHWGVIVVGGLVISTIEKKPWLVKKKDNWIQINTYVSCHQVLPGVVEAWTRREQWRDWSHVPTYIYPGVSMWLFYLVSNPCTPLDYLVSIPWILCDCVTIKTCLKIKHWLFSNQYVHSISLIRNTQENADAYFLYCVEVDKILIWFSALCCILYKNKCVYCAIFFPFSSPVPHCA